jgi:hypothetical protein
LLLFFRKEDLYFLRHRRSHLDTPNFDRPMEAGHWTREAKPGLASAGSPRNGLSYVELTTDPRHIASQKVIEACGGKPVGRFRKSQAYGNKEAIRFRIDLL